MEFKVADEEKRKLYEHGQDVFLLQHDLKFDPLFKFECIGHDKKTNSAKVVKGHKLLLNFNEDDEYSGVSKILSLIITPFFILVFHFSQTGQTNDVEIFAEMARNGIYILQLYTFLLTFKLLSEYYLNVGLALTVHTKFVHYLRYLCKVQQVDCSQKHINHFDEQINRNHFKRDQEDENQAGFFQKLKKYCRKTTEKRIINPQEKLVINSPINMFVPENVWNTTILRRCAYKKISSVSTRFQWCLTAVFIWVSIGDLILIVSYLPGAQFYGIEFFGHVNNKQQLFWYTVTYNILLELPAFLSWLWMFWQSAMVNEHFNQQALDLQCQLEFIQSVSLKQMQYFDFGEQNGDELSERKIHMDKYIYLEADIANGQEEEDRKKEDKKIQKIFYEYVDLKRKIQVEDLQEKKFEAGDLQKKGNDADDLQQNKKEDQKITARIKGEETKDEAMQLRYKKAEEKYMERRKKGNGLNCLHLAGASGNESISVLIRTMLHYCNKTIGKNIEKVKDSDKNIEKESEVQKEKAKAENQKANKAYNEKKLNERFEELENAYQLALESVLIDQKTIQFSFLGLFKFNYRTLTAALGSFAYIVYTIVSAITKYTNANPETGGSTGSQTGASSSNSTNSSSSS